MTLLIFFVVLSVLVLVHELGHFLAAKKAGILVEEFGLGLPPRLWGKKIGETIYSINWLPFGGFVKLFGEDDIDSSTKAEIQISEERVEIETTKVRGKEQLRAELDTMKVGIKEDIGSTIYDSGRAFFGKTKKARAVVLTAGVVMNFLLGVVLFSIIYSVTGIPTKTNEVRIEEVMSGSPAETGGLISGDSIKEVWAGKEHQVIKDSEKFVEAVNQNVGKEITLVIERLGEEKKLALTPRANPPEGQGALGVVVGSTEMKHYVWWQMPFRGAWWGLKEALNWGVIIVSGLYQMIKNLLTLGIVPKDVAGPVGIYQLTGMAAEAGFLILLQFVGILSVHLAIINILPLPALDGGRLLFLGVEAVTGRKVDGKWEHLVHSIGMVVLLSLMLLVTINDIVRLVGAANLADLVKKILP